jgi:hypothetical protein
LTRRLKDVKGDGNIDTIYFFKDNVLVLKESDTDGDGYFDLRVVSKNGQRVRQEADTNKDRRVDVWVFYKDTKKVQQDEDRNYNGRVDARYIYQDGKVIKQERVTETEPVSQAATFSSTQKELSRKTEGHGRGLGEERRVMGTAQEPVTGMR